MWKKRGLSICFMNYDMLFLGPHIVSLAVYTVDATVICFHGGCECGQGINTKVFFYTITQDCKFKNYTWTP